MSRISSIAKIVGQINRLKLERAPFLSSTFSTMQQSPFLEPSKDELVEHPTNRTLNDPTVQIQFKGVETKPRRQVIGENVSRKDKVTFLLTTLMDLPNNKEAVYRALDAWVAWEHTFPIGQLKQVLMHLEKEQQWHQMIQVIKWMLSKGQGNTQGTYCQLIRALDKDHRVEEAHEIWTKKLGYDLHSVSWKACELMIGVYYRNNMLEELVKLFKGLEAFDRKPPGKALLRMVANGFELYGLPQEKERILEKYKKLFDQSPKRRPNKRVSGLLTAKEEPW